ncbi:hypothetical protein GCM10010156_12280 [Planobispora rosea]|uniref:HTH merR-type domain-containing protein n=1 Tax=Planobispora rosea TaxID=35762 RepID=A0A8J3RX60_PLARO|nr:MerR family transcriptional regulator [Planobispora rosea]GGS55038.1 hypothetical protein GCM10010156_12280 [Planobispora rosea]GIH82829.1 hypothetical protein Pro02_12370 [Planobispora rosea]
MEWTIGELVERASQALGPAERPNGRVRDVPNERLVRWYATIGLLDPPLARRGRVALYGRRHLLQLIAVKRRQADGRSIAEIQAELTGATDRALETIARIPAGLPPAPGDTVTPTAPADPGHGSPGATGHGPPGTTGAGNTAAPKAARPRFWAEAPAPPPAPGAGGPPSTAPDREAAGHTTEREAAGTTAAAGPAGPGTAAAARLPVTAVPALRLAPGVTLLLDGAGRTPSGDDLAAIGAASEALVTLLRNRELAPPEGSP